MNTPERWSTASSDSDLSSIFSSGNCFSEFRKNAGRESVFVERGSCRGKLWRNFFIVGVLPLCFSSLSPNYSYFKQKADGKDYELRISSTYFSRKLRFCMVSSMWHICSGHLQPLSNSTMSFYELSEKLRLYSSIIDCSLVCLNC